MKLRTSCVFLLVLAALSYGQAVNGTLLGTITDATGASAPGAKVTITESNTGVTRWTSTNESGNYVFPDLPPGKYNVVVELAGFNSITQNGVDVLVNTSPRLDQVLKPGDVTERLVVTTEAPLLQTDRADTGRQFEAVQTASLPLAANRNFQSLLNLVPGTTRAFFQHSQFFNATSSLQTQVNGNMRHGNNYQIEGIDNNERTGLLQILIPPIEAIDTVSVSTGNFEAELGRASGAVTNVQLKSGSNRPHGAAYEFLQNNALNSRSYFNPSVGHLVYNYFGGNIGGPIRRNRTFFFGDFLRITDHEANANPATVPSPAFRDGDLGALLGLSTPQIIYNPFTGNSDGSGRAPFPDNQIPPALINPISCKLMGLIPRPNQPYTAASMTNDFFALLPFRKNTNSFDVKIDASPSDNDRLSGRFSFSRPVVFQAPIFGVAGGPGPNGGFQGTGIQKTYSTGINYNRVFSNTLIAEFRVGVAHYRNEARTTDYGSSSTSALGIPGVNLDAWTSGMTGVKINGGWGNSISDPILGYSASLPWIRAEANIDYVNTWTKSYGDHTMKWGVDVRRVRDDLLQTQTFSPRGRFDFSEPQTTIPGAKTGFGNAWASFLLDQPSQAGRDLASDFPTYRAWQVFAFVQDKWVASPKLTLDLGTRWEFYPPGTPRLPGLFSNYNPDNNSLVIAGIGANPMDLGMAKRYTYFAPRFGLAYRLSKSMVVRAGFGISYTPFPDNKYAFDNFPVKQNNIYSPAGNGYGPALLANGQTATFQAGFPPPTPAAIPSNGIIANADRNQQYEVIPLDYKNPYTESWNFSVQQSLPLRLTLDVAYAGNHGVRSPAAMNLNAATVIGLGTRGQPQYPRTANTIQYWQGFSSMYNALQAKLDRRFSAGLLITTAYTWGKALSYQTGDDGGLMFYVKGYERRNYALADFNRAHTFVQSYVYDLPMGKGKRLLTGGAAAAILGGWQVNGILTLMSGLPVNITCSASGLAAPGNQQTPDLVAPVTFPHGINTGNQWFSIGSFAVPAAGRFGALGRNRITGPAFFNLDFSLFKNIALGERFKLQLRGEAFAVTNTPQFAQPGGTLGSANFGYITSVISSGSGVNGTGGGRAIQLGAKLTF